MSTDKLQYHPDQTRTDRFVFLGIAIVVALLYVLFMNQPLYGDGYGYGYNSAKWMVENNLQPIPAGMGRGERCMGHPAGFFWLWAIIMKIFGDHIHIAHILPAITAFLSLGGMYKLGKTLGGTLLGILTSAALLASPLFITQAFRPLPDAAMIAAISWSLYYFINGKNIHSAFLCFIAVMMREQAVFLAASYFIAELIRSRLKKPKLLLLWCSPLLVILFTAIGNQFVNGYFFWKRLVSSQHGVLPEGWIAFRFRLFGGHLLAENYRWIPVVGSLAFLLWNSRLKKIAIPLTLGLILLALSRATWLPYLLSIALITLLAILIRRRIKGDIWLVLIILVLFSILFHVFIVTAGVITELDLLRYVMCAYPAVIAGSLAIIARLGKKKVLTAVSVLFMAASFSTNFSVPYWNQADTTLAVLQQQEVYINAIEIAVEYGDTIIVPESEIKTLIRPGLGYVDSPYPARTLGRTTSTLSYEADYTVIIPHSHKLTGVFLEMVQAALPSSSVLGDQNTIIEGEFKVDLYRITATQ